MLGITGMKYKKDLKALVGQDISLNIVETSIFGLEYKETGKFAVAHDPYGKRDWFAELTVEDNILVKVS